jgi:GNAT superfamily N-acetyltransferase
MKIEVRRAQPSEAASLTETARAAKRHWGYPERYLELWRDALTLTPDFIIQYDVYVATNGDQLLGFYALVADGQQMELEHLWVMPARIGQGVGRLLFQHALERACLRRAAAIGITADPHAEGFYLRMGAKRVGVEMSTLEGKPRVLPRLVFEIRGARQVIADDAQKG